MRGRAAHGENKLTLLSGRPFNPCRELTYVPLKPRSAALLCPALQWVNQLLHNPELMHHHSEDLSPSPHLTSVSASYFHRTFACKTHTCIFQVQEISLPYKNISPLFSSWLHDLTHPHQHHCHFRNPDQGHRGHQAAWPRSEHRIGEGHTWRNTAIILNRMNMNFRVRAMPVYDSRNL